MTSHAEKWHADPALLSRYVAGALDGVTSASVEQHVNRCGSCRLAVGRLLEPQLLERAWVGVRDATERPLTPVPMRVARRLGLPESTGVLLAAAASLRGAWLVGAFLAMSFATLAAYASEGQALAPFLLAAPLAPVLGVAAAYGPRQDPFEALVATAPYGRTRLILLRTLGVLISVLPFTVLLGLALPGPAWLAAAWLGPALALVPTLLAAAGFVGPRIAAAGLTLVWSGIVLGATRFAGPTWPVEAAQQTVYLGVAAAACAVIAVRTRTERQPGLAL